MKKTYSILHYDKDRNFFWDNLKFILITLVVLGHFVSYYTPVSLEMKKIFFGIYTFHMPLFIFISGFFSKKSIQGKFKVEKITGYLILYLILKLLYYTLRKYIFAIDNVEFKLFIESGVPWYLLAMSVWLSITYIIRDFRPKFILPLAIIGGVLVGYDNTIVDYFCLSRVIVFLPFFLLGYYTNQEDITRLFKCKILKYISVSVLIISIIILLIWGGNVYHFRPFLTGRQSYIMANEPIYGGVFRLIFYAISTIISIGIIYIVPKRKTFFTSIGKRTLQVYFMHDLLLL